MDNFWFEEELGPSDAVVEELLSSLKSGGLDASQIQDSARGIVRVDRPRWRELNTKVDMLLTSNEESRYFLIRFGFQFDIIQISSFRRARFISARCAALLRPIDGKQPSPLVYDIFPHELTDGEPRKVNVKIAPKITIAPIQVSAGEAGKDVDFGTVEPIIRGFAGDDEQEPYWELRPKGRGLSGTRHLWLIVELPTGCDGVQIVPIVKADLQTRFGPIPVGPKQPEWNSRYHVLIAPDERLIP